MDQPAAGTKPRSRTTADDVGDDSARERIKYRGNLRKYDRLGEDLRVMERKLVRDV
jgi:hypothetical protein